MLKRIFEKQGRREVETPRDESYDLYLKAKSNRGSKSLNLKINSANGSLRENSEIKPDTLHGGTETFPLSIAMLQDLVDPKDFKKLRALGGVKGLEKNLKTDTQRGLTPELLQIEKRHEQ